MELQYVKTATYQKKPFVCPYNDACRCMEKTCRSCGWNPKVAQKRLEKIWKGVNDHG